MKQQQIKAFTLVELIIVITILAILATIGFMSFQSYTLDARDGKRVTDLGEIRNGLEIYQTKKQVVPIPDAQVTNIVNGGLTLVYQGYAGTNVLSKIKASGDIKDPKENISYTYSTNGDYTKFQLLSMLENGTTVNLSQTPLNTTYAANNYLGRKTYVVGNKLGIFLDNTTNTPIQETITGTINLAGTNSGTIFKVVLSNTTTNSGVITGTGVSLYNTIIDLTKITPQTVTVIGAQTNPGLSCLDIKTKVSTSVDGIYWIKPTGISTAFQVYCDMTTDGGGWTRVYMDTTSSENYSRLRNCNTNGYYYEANFECIKPTIGVFTNIKFTRSGYTSMNFNSSVLTYGDSGGCGNTGSSCYVGWQASNDGGVNRYTMREYKHIAFGFNSGRWGTSHSNFQSQIIVYGK